MVEGQLRDSIRNIQKKFYTTRTRVRSGYRPTAVGAVEEQREEIIG